MRERLAAPLMAVNNVPQNKVEPTAQTATPSNDRNTQFINQVSAQNVESATANYWSTQFNYCRRQFHSCDFRTATNSDLPGYVKSEVSEPSYSEDGTTILIPKGSRLIGQYKSGMLQGQSRIFISLD